MANEYTFLRIYKALAFQHAREEDLTKLYWDLQDRVGGDPNLRKWFEKDVPTPLDSALAIDAVAHTIHQGAPEVLKGIFPNADYGVMKGALDELAGLEKSNEVRKYNRGYFTTLLSSDGLFLLEKQSPSQPAGMATKEAILPAIKEYERLYKAGLASPAEILTLARFYPDNLDYQQMVQKRGLTDEDKEPVVIGGPASVAIVDKEGHLITTDALRDAFGKFMKNFRARNINVLHSDVQVGWALPAYIAKNGQIYASGVDDKQLWLLGELRDDTRISQRVAKEVTEGNLRSYSIAGSALQVTPMQKGANKFTQVDELQLAEVTLCCPESVRVWTRKGLKSIKDVQKGEEVLTHEKHWRPVKETFNRAYSGELVRITGRLGELMVTPEHPVRVMRYGGDGRGARYEWVPAGGVHEGDSISVHQLKDMAGVKEALQEFSGNTLSKVLSVERVPFDGTVYNLGVEEDESYTTEAGVLHNCTKGMNQGAMFDVLKSAPEEAAKPDLGLLLKSFGDAPITLPGFSVIVEKGDTPSVIVCADRSNTLTDALVFELSKSLPNGVQVAVREVGGGIPVYKLQLLPVWSGEAADNGENELVPALVFKGDSTMSALQNFLGWMEKQVNPLKDYESRQKKHRNLLDEEGFPEETQGAEEISDPVISTHAEPWTVNEAGEEYDANIDAKDKKEMREEGA